MTTNYSLHAIPVFWFIALYPHAYAVSLIKKWNGNKWDNLNPRGVDTNPSYQKAVPAACYAAFEKAEAAHKNGLEAAPFFVGAVLAGNMAGVDAWTMNIVSGMYLGLRVVYTMLYIKCTRQKTSRLRSMTWIVSVLLLMGLYVKAGNAWAAKY